MPTRRLLLLLALAALVVPSGAAAHDLLDHAPPSRGVPVPPSPAFQSGGEGASWALVGTVFTGNPQSDLDFFEQGGATFASVGTLGTGANGGGQNIVRLTDDNGEVVAPTQEAFHPSADCVSDPVAVLGLQHDVESTPKGDTILNVNNAAADRRDTQLLLDATDAGGRCHDQGPTGLSDPLFGMVAPPPGGLEIVDVTDRANPVEIGLTSHIGEAHTVNVDPKRPHIAYVVTSDTVSVTDQRRNNENQASSQRFNLDGFEIMDLSSCMDFPAGTSVEDKRAACKPDVFRYRYPELSTSQGHTLKNNINGCHELEIYPDDRLTCGSGTSALVFDMARAFNDSGTPDNFSDDRINGTPLACSERGSTSNPAVTTGATITDCVVGEDDADLTVSGWIADGAPSVTGVRHLGSAFHAGRAATDQIAPFDSTEDIDFNHETEFTQSGRFLLATDERGGGVAPPGATCPAVVDNTLGNGGIHAYRADRLLPATPEGEDAAEVAQRSYARTGESGGEDKAIFRVPIRTEGQASICTAHVFQQIPGQNRIFMGWYSQGTQVVDFTENPDGTIDFENAGFFIPANANTWVSHIFKMQENPDGTITYWGATGDFFIAESGRSAVDVYRVTLPAPPDPADGPIVDGGSTSPGVVAGGGFGSPRPAAAPATPAASTGTGTPGSPAPRPSASDAAQCVSANGFRRARVARRGGGLRFDFAARRSNAQVRVELFQQSQGRNVTGERRVQDFGLRRRAFNWNGRGRGGRRLSDGVYFVRYRTLQPNGRRDVRRIALVRRNGRFSTLRAFDLSEGCGLLRSFKLERPVFGGRTNRALNTSFRVGQESRVTVTVRRGNRVVRRFAERTVRPGRTNRLRMTVTRALGRGDYRVTITVRAGGRTVTQTLTSRRV